MSDNDKEILKEKVKSAIRISSQLFIAKKRALGQKIIISEEGKIREIEPLFPLMVQSGGYHPLDTLPSTSFTPPNPTLPN